MSGGLLVVTAHPDDEVLIAGGTLAACADAGVPTAVACLTRGEEGPIQDPLLATRESLPRVREAELAAACAELGVGWVKCYRRADGYLRWSPGAAIVRQLAGVLERLRPDAVITFGEDGLYYHPDHIAAYEYTLRAVAEVADAPALYRSVWPKDLMPQLALELKQRGLPSDLWELDPAAFGTEDRAQEIVVDVRAQSARKLSALRCHRTQLGPENAFTVIPADLVEPVLGYERFVAVRGGGEWLAHAVGAVSAHA